MFLLNILEAVGGAGQNLAAESHNCDDTTDGTLVHDNDVTNSSRITAKPNEKYTKSSQVTKITNKASRANVKSPKIRSSFREQCKSRRNAELDCDPPDSNSTKDPTPIKQVNESTTNKSRTPPIQHIESSKKVVFAVQEQICTKSNENVDRSIKNINNVPDAKVAVPAHAEERTAKSDLSERLVNENSEGNTCNMERKEKRKNEKDPAVSEMKKTKIKTYKTSESSYRKCKETTTTAPQDDQKAETKRKCKQVHIVSETCIKCTVEPPSVVGSMDMCATWINRNNNSENLNGETVQSNNTGNAVTVTEEREKEKLQGRVSPATDESSYAVTTKSLSTDDKNYPAVVASTSRAMANGMRYKYLW